MPSNEEMYIKSKFIENEERSYSQNPTEKNVNEMMKNKEENYQDETNLHSDEKKLNNKENKTSENKIDKKQTNKTKKKHLVSEGNSNNDKNIVENYKQSKINPVSSLIIMGKQFDDDIHDGAAERPPGAILLLTLGILYKGI